MIPLAMVTVMRTMKLYLHGVTMGTRPTSSPHVRAKRGKVGGWSEGATRRNVAFLRSVVADGLSESHNGPLAGFAVTLTLRDCPASSQDFHKLRRAYLKRLERAGLHRCHWVIEWQRRGVPHIHGAIWLPWGDLADSSPLRKLIIDHWLDVAGTYGVSRRAQHVTPITDAVGWFQYVAKHAARGVKHYQRSAENIPEGWKTTGRMWGYTGEWDLREPIHLDVSDDVYFRMRRLARSWRKADARASGDSYRIKTARGLLKHPDPEISKLRGISEWISMDDVLMFVDIARGSTGSVEQVWRADQTTPQGLFGQQVEPVT